MDKLTRQFFGDARKLQMHPTEKAQVWDQISMRASSSPVKMSSLEKAESFSEISQHMKKNPLQVARHPMRHFFALHRVGAMAMCAVLLVGAGGGGVAYAAEDAMPEDVLYPVKLHFNERLVGAFHRSPERRADWEQRRLDRRLGEAEHLSNRPEFTGKRREMLEQRIDKRINAFEEHIENVPEVRRAELEERFQKRFDQHQEFLEKMEEGTVSKEEVQKFKKRMIDVRSRIKKPGMRLQKVDKKLVSPLRLEGKPPLDARLSEQKHTLDSGRGLQNTRKIAPSSLRKSAPKRLEHRR